MLHGCWNHPDVRRYLFDDYVVTQAMAQGLLDHCLAVQNDGLGLWMVSLRDEDTFIGCAGLNPVGIAAHCWTMASSPSTGQPLPRSTTRQIWRPKGCC